MLRVSPQGVGRRSSHLRSQRHGAEVDDLLHPCQGSKYLQHGSIVTITTA